MSNVQSPGCARDSVSGIACPSGFIVLSGLPVLIVHVVPNSIWKRCMCLKVCVCPGENMS